MSMRITDRLARSALRQNRRLACTEIDSLKPGFWIEGAMPPELSADSKFEIGHVLFIDIVGYSKLLIEEQSERLGELTRSCSGRRRCATRPTNNSLGCQPATAWRWSFITARKSRRAVRSRFPRHCGSTRNFACGWGFTADQLTETTSWILDRVKLVTPRPPFRKQTERSIGLRVLFSRRHRQPAASRAVDGVAHLGLARCNCSCVRRTDLRLRHWKRVPNPKHRLFFVVDERVRKLFPLRRGSVYCHDSALSIGSHDYPARGHDLAVLFGGHVDGLIIYLRV